MASDFTPVLSEFWTLFVYLLVAIAAMLFFSWYRERLLAQALSVILRAYLWPRYKVWIDVECIRIAPIGGKILFKHLRYQSCNESFAIVQGQVTFRYWLRNVRLRGQSSADAAAVASEEVRSGAASTAGASSHVPATPPAGGADSRANAQCRFFVHLDGVEWFIYNRTDAYEYISKILGEEQAAASEQQQQREEFGDAKGSKSHSIVNIDAKQAASLPIAATSADLICQILPVDISLGKGAILLGNSEMPSIAALQFESGSGVYNITDAEQPEDPYRTHVQILFAKARLLFNPNVDYAQKSAAAKDGDGAHGADTEPEGFFRRLRVEAARLWDVLHIFHTERDLKPAGETDARGYWRGLHRYQQAFTVDKMKQLMFFEEYAKSTAVLDCAELDLGYYTDAAGLCADAALPEYRAPRWGALVHFAGAEVTYGPWAHRQSAEMQKFLSPYIHRDLTATARPAVGEVRTYESFALRAEFTDELVWRVPSREPSKDWRYRRKFAEEADGAAPNASQTSLFTAGGPRPYAWVDLKVSGRAVLEMDMALVARDESGYTSTITLDIPAPWKLLSSLNYAPLLEAPSFRLRILQHAPLEWDMLHTWDVEVTMSAPQVYFLWDHAVLLQDLIADWNDPGPAAPAADADAREQSAFIPYRYNLAATLSTPTICFHVNEKNIIQNPNDPNDNAFLTFHMTEVSMKSAVVFDNEWSEKSLIPLEVSVPETTISLSVPKSTTYESFLDADLFQRVGIIGALSVKLDYRYWNAFSPDESNHMAVDVHAAALHVDAHGVLVRYVEVLLENYFGSRSTFITLEEYRREYTRQRGRGKRGTFGRQDAPGASQKDLDDFLAPAAAAAAEGWRHEEAIDRHRFSAPATPLDVALSFRVNELVFDVPATMYRRGAVPFASISVRDPTLQFFTGEHVTELAVSCSLARVNLPEPAERGSSSSRMAAFFAVPADSRGLCEIGGLSFFMRDHLSSPPTSVCYETEYAAYIGPVVGDVHVTERLVLDAERAIRGLLFGARDADNAISFANGPAAGGDTPLLPRLLQLRCELAELELRLHFDERSLGTLKLAEGARLSIEAGCTATSSERFELEAKCAELQLLYMSPDAFSSYSPCGSSWFLVAALALPLHVSGAQRAPLFHNFARAQSAFLATTRPATEELPESLFSAAEVRGIARTAFLGRGYRAASEVSNGSAGAEAKVGGGSVPGVLRGLERSLQRCGVEARFVEHRAQDERYSPSDYSFTSSTTGAERSPDRRGVKNALPRPAGRECAFQQSSICVRISSVSAFAFLPAVAELFTPGDAHAGVGGEHMADICQIELLDQLLAEDALVGGRGSSLTAEVHVARLETHLLLRPTQAAAGPVFGCTLQVLDTRVRVAQRTGGSGGGSPGPQIFLDARVKQISAQNGRMGEELSGTVEPAAIAFGGLVDNSEMAPISAVQVHGLRARKALDVACVSVAVARADADGEPLALLGPLHAVASEAMRVGERWRRHTRLRTAALREMAVRYFSDAAARAQQDARRHDPTFMSSPSNIWRLGNRAWQNDDGWKVLMYLRHCAARTGPSPDTLSPRPLPTRQELGERVRALRSWDFTDFSRLSLWGVASLRSISSSLAPQQPIKKFGTALRLVLGRLQLCGLVNVEHFNVASDMAAAEHIASVQSVQISAVAARLLPLVRELLASPPAVIESSSQPPTLPDPAALATFVADLPASAPRATATVHVRQLHCAVPVTAEISLELAVRSAAVQATVQGTGVVAVQSLEITLLLRSAQQLTLQTQNLSAFLTSSNSSSNSGSVEGTHNEAVLHVPHTQFACLANPIETYTLGGTVVREVMRLIDSLVPAKAASQKDVRVSEKQSRGRRRRQYLSLRLGDIDMRWHLLSSLVGRYRVESVHAELVEREEGTGVELGVIPDQLSFQQQQQQQQQSDQRASARLAFPPVRLCGVLQPASREAVGLCLLESFAMALSASAADHLITMLQVLAETMNYVLADWRTGPSAAKPAAPREAIEAWQLHAKLDVQGYQVSLQNNRGTLRHESGRSIVVCRRSPAAPTAKLETSVTLTSSGNLLEFREQLAGGDSGGILGTLEFATTVAERTATVHAPTIVLEPEAIARLQGFVEVAMSGYQSLRSKFRGDLAKMRQRLRSRKFASASEADGAAAAAERSLWKQIKARVCIAEPRLLIRLERGAAAYGLLSSMDAMVMSMEYGRFASLDLANWQSSFPASEAQRWTHAEVNRVSLASIQCALEGDLQFSAPSRLRGNISIASTEVFMNHFFLPQVVALVAILQMTVGEPKWDASAESVEPDEELPPREVGGPLLDMWQMSTRVEVSVAQGRLSLFSVRNKTRIADAVVDVPAYTLSARFDARATAVVSYALLSIGPSENLVRATSLVCLEEMLVQMDRIRTPAPATPHSRPPQPPQATAPSKLLSLKQLPGLGKRDSLLFRRSESDLLRTAIGAFPASGQPLSVATAAKPKRPFNFTFLLKWAPSRLILTTAPHSKVECLMDFADISVGLNVIESDFVGATCRIGSIYMQLHHEYSPEPFVKASFTLTTLTAAYDGRAAAIAEGNGVRPEAPQDDSLAPLTLAASTQSADFDLNIRHLEALYIFQNTWSINRQQQQQQQPWPAELGPPATPAASEIGFSVDLLLSRINLNIDLTHSIGKIFAEVSNTRVQFDAKRAQADAYLRCVSEAATTRCEGRFHGTPFAAKRVLFEAADRAVQLSAEEVFSAIVLNTEMLHYADIRALQFAASSSRVVLHAERYIAILGPSSVPHYVSDISKLYLSLRTKRAMALAKFDVSRRALPLPGTSSALQTMPASRAALTLDLVLANGTVLLFKEKIAFDAPFLEVDLVQLGVAQTRHGEEVSHSLRFTTEGALSLRKMPSQASAQTAVGKAATAGETGGPGVLNNAGREAEPAGAMRLPDIATWPAWSWAAVVRASSCTPIIKLPPSTLAMSATRGDAAAAQEVQYTLEVDFSAAIDVSLNLNLFRNVQDMVQRYTTGAARAFELLQTGDAAPPIAPPEDTESGVKLTFKATAPIVLNPQLKVLEGATPREALSFLGIKKDHVPVHVYGLICILDELGGRINRIHTIFA